MTRVPRWQVRLRAAKGLREGRCRAGKLGRPQLCRCHSRSAANDASDERRVPKPTPRKKKTIANFSGLPRGRCVLPRSASPPHVLLMQAPGRDMGLISAGGRCLYIFISCYGQLEFAWNVLDAVPHDRSVYIGQASN